MGFPSGLDGKGSVCHAGGPGLIPGSGKIPQRREWLLTPVFLPGESHGQRSLVGYCLQGCKESDMVEQLTLLLSFTEHSLEFSRFFCVVACIGTSFLFVEYILPCGYTTFYFFIHQLMGFGVISAFWLL